MTSASVNGSRSTDAGGAYRSEFLRTSLSLRGMLDLRMAVAAARRQDRGVTVDLLGRAEAAAALLGRDANYWKTGFGPTNVLPHRLSTSLNLRDVSLVADTGVRIEGHPLPAERRASHRIDVARP